MLVYFSFCVLDNSQRELDERKKKKITASSYDSKKCINENAVEF